MAIATILAALTIAGAASVISLIVAMFLLNVLWALGKPSLLSLVPNIVPRKDLQDAVALTSLGFLAGQIVGPLIAAGAMAASGAGLAFAINALTYGAPIVSMFYLGRLGLGGRAVRSDRSAGPLERSPSAVAFLRKNLWVSGLLAGIVVTSMAMEIQRTLAPGLVFEKLRIPESNAGLLVAAQSVGSAIALVMFVQIRKYGWSRRSAFVGLLTQAGGVLAAATAANLPIALVGFGFIGLGFALCFPVLTAALQGATPDELRGRVMSFHQLALLGHRPVTALVVGAVATAFGLVSATLIWLILVPVGLVAVRTAWRRLPEDRATGGLEDELGEATADGAQHRIAEG
jgi:MFS family permease